MKPSQKWERNSSNSSTSGRSFLSRTLARRDRGIGESTDDLKGPLGLTTLFGGRESVVCDLIFVHGLGGGSRSTWTYASDPSLFWPKEWLPRDEDFNDTRIHSFGYSSNWEKESSLNVHDFSKSLLGSIQDCPTIPRNSLVRETWLSFLTQMLMANLL